MVDCVSCRFTVLLTIYFACYDFSDAYQKQVFIVHGYTYNTHHFTKTKTVIEVASMKRKAEELQQFEYSIPFNLLSF